MSKLREELSKLQEDEKEKEEKEMEVARKRQKAVDDLDRGVSDHQVSLALFFAKLFHFQKITTAAQCGKGAEYRQ